MFTANSNELVCNEAIGMRFARKRTIVAHTREIVRTSFKDAAKKIVENTYINIIRNGQPFFPESIATHSAFLNANDFGYCNGWF